MTKLIIETKNNIATLTLNRPEKANALSNELIQEITAACKTITEDKNIHVVVLKGNGKHFCAGADLNDMKSMINFSRDENIQNANELAELFETVDNLAQPLLGVAHGSVYGGGIGLLACCDIVIAEENSSFCFSEVKLGLSPATISPYVVRHIGIKQARRYFLSAEKFTAEAAQHMGLVDICCEKDKTEEKTNELTDAILKNSPNAMAVTKQFIKQLHPITQDTINKTSGIIADLRISDDAQQRLKNFFD